MLGIVTEVTSLRMGFVMRRGHSIHHSIRGEVGVVFVVFGVVAVVGAGAGAAGTQVALEAGMQIAMEQTTTMSKA